MSNSGFCYYPGFLTGFRFKTPSGFSDLIHSDFQPGDLVEVSFYINSFSSNAGGEQTYGVYPMMTGAQLIEKAQKSRTTVSLEVNICGHRSDPK